MATTLASPIDAALDQQPKRFAARLLLVYSFMLYSRIFEAGMAWGLPNLYVILVLSAAALLIVLLQGEFVRVVREPLGILLVLFTGWAVFALPFSDWKSESLHQFSGVWLKSAAAYFIIAGLTRDFSDSRKTFAVFGWAAALSAVLLALMNRNIGGRMGSVGTLGNANEAAFHIMFGLPFLILLISRVKPILKLPLVAIAFLSLAVSLKTASRAGLLMAGVLTIVAIFKVSFANKVKILAIAALAGVIGLLTIDKLALERYQTMFDDNDGSAAAASARESAESRKYLLKEGITLTLEHPVFGVGMGVFPVAAAELSKSRGEHPLWLVSHNSYIQVSSETGFIGLFLMLGIFGVCFSLIMKLDRTAKRLDLKEVRGMSLCLLLSFIALTIDYFFDAAAYDLYMPMAAGLVTALVATTRPLIKEAEERAGLPEASVAVRQADAQTSSPEEERSAVARNRSPYRLGRKRVSGR